jgi:hypothetical protein
MATWPFFAVVTVVLGAGVLIEPDTLTRRLTTIVAVGILISILHLISRRGRPMLASWLLVMGLTLIVTQRAWITGGMHAPIAAFYALFIVMAGALIGPRGGVVTAAACVVGAFVLTGAEAMRLLTPPAGATSPVASLVMTLLAIGIALVMQSLVTPGSRREGLSAY